MYYLGLDIASDNPGYSILSGPQNIVFSKTFVTPSKHKESEILKCLYQQKVFERILSLKDFSAIAIEAPAFSFSNRMVSIGMIHGAILPLAINSGIPIVYIPPTKWKYAILGKGNCDKSIGVDFVLKNFKFSKGLDLKKFDNNQADAAMLAYCAYLFIEFCNFEEPFIFDTLKKRVKEIFFSEKISSKKKSGIMHRKNEFFFNKDFIWQK